MENLGINRWIILKWILQKLGGSIRAGFIWLGQGAVACCCLRGCESDINSGGFLTSWETFSFWRRPLLHEVSFVHIMTVVPLYSFMSAQLFVPSLLHIFLCVEYFITIQILHLNLNFIFSIGEEQKNLQKLTFCISRSVVYCVRQINATNTEY